ncbi:Lysyl oxidase [compost metagenome]
MYPDWLSIPPRDVFVDGTPKNRRLRFDTALANIGSGHVQIRNRIEGDTGIAVQDILDGDNRVVYTQEVSRFVYEKTHGHNHVDDIARYELREGGPAGPVIRTATKVSFCVEDSFKYRYNTTETARYIDCKPEMMGITRGYADLYSANLPGQEFNVTGLPAGEYYMVIHVDPYKKFLDSSRTNNIAWTRIYLDSEAGTLELRGNSP